MTRVDSLHTTMQRWMLISTVGAFMLACGGGTRETTGGTARSDLITEAESNYSYGAERKPVLVDTTIIKGPGGTLPTITISTATQKSSTGRVPNNRFIYKLQSTGAYAAMGIAPGENYIWRDTSSSREGPYRTLVVPKDTAYPMVWLRRDTSVASYAPLPATEPRLVQSAFGYGACDNNCVPHCATRDILRAFTSSDTLRVLLKP
jgi:hypothetical protein